MLLSSVFRKMLMWKVSKILYYDRTDVYECIYVYKSSVSREFIICHYWYLLGKWFKFESTFCIGCHDVLIMSIDINSIFTLNIYEYQHIILGITKIGARNLSRNVDLSDKSGSLFFYCI